MRIAVSGGSGTIGRYVVEATTAAGHEARILSRAHGVDVQTGDGLPPVLEGVDAIVDVSNSDRHGQESATDFFTRVARSLQTIGAQMGVGHIVTLSIVGIDRTGLGYHQAKLAHEEAAADGSVPHTILRATHTHELPARLIEMTRRGSEAQVFDVQVQPVAARTTAELLAEIARGPAVGRAPDLGGPEELNLLDMGRAFARRYLDSLTVVADETTMADVPPGAILPSGVARYRGPTFAQWLESADAAAVA